jgi:hypothetical protein
MNDDNSELTLEMSLLLIASIYFLYHIAKWAY